MTIIDMKELDSVFDMIQEVNKTAPEQWRDQILNQMTSHNGIEEFRDLAKLKATVQNFIEENKIGCPENTVDDWVYENAPEFVEKLANIVGYYKYDE